MAELIKLSLLEDKPALSEFATFYFPHNGTK